MSRCYGFPPPGYTSKRSTSNENDALIFSIKDASTNLQHVMLQRENEKAISDREREKKVRSSSSDKKEKKREKKERKKHKEKDKSHHTGDGLVKENQVAKLYESELFEKSSVTEEHGQPIDLQKASCSSDSTGNNSKKKRTSTPPNSIQSHGNGNILRIRLSSQKTDDQPSTSGCNGQGTSVPLHQREEHNKTLFRNFQPCSGILREEPSPKRNDVKLALNNKKLNQATSITGHTLHPVPRQDQKLLRLSEKIASVPSPAPPLTLAPVPAPAPAAAPVSAPKEEELSPHAAAPVSTPKEKLSCHAAAPVSAPKEEKLSPHAATPVSAPKEEKLSSHEKKILKRELKYKKLFESWVPPMVPHEVVMDGDNDDDWLFGNKGDEKPAKKLKPSDSHMNEDGLLPCISSVLQPRANYLSGVDMYVMPFTIPF